MKCILVDDERNMLLRLEDAVKEVYPNAEIFSFNSALGVEECVIKNDIAVAFLDINLPGKTGIELAKRIKLISPKVNVIFCTGYDEYAIDAISLHASGYLLKPITAEKIKEAMDNLIYPITSSDNKKIGFRCFGVLKAFYDNKPLHFKYSKTEEMLAFLVDRRGQLVKPMEIEVNLFDGDVHSSYLYNLRNDLIQTLNELGCKNILDLSWGKIGIKKELVSCDLYDFLDNKPDAIRAFNGEYMSQYEWAEYSLDKLMRTYKLHK